MFHKHQMGGGGISGNLEHPWAVKFSYIYDMFKLCRGIV